jgi:hypothetical protein
VWISRSVAWRPIPSSPRNSSSPTNSLSTRLLLRAAGAGCARFFYVQDVRADNCSSALASSATAPALLYLRASCPNALLYLLHPWSRARSALPPSLSDIHFLCDTCISYTSDAQDKSAWSRLGQPMAARRRDTMDRVSPRRLLPPMPGKALNQPLSHLFCDPIQFTAPPCRSMLLIVD